MGRFEDRETKRCEGRLFEVGKDKLKINKARHKISLWEGIAVLLGDPPTYDFQDHTGQERFKAIGRTEDDKLATVIFSKERDGKLRYTNIISVWLMKGKEKRDYLKEQEKLHHGAVERQGLGGPYDGGAGPPRSRRPRRRRRKRPE